MSDIQKADPHARKWAIWIVIGGALFGTTIIAGYGYFERQIYGWIEDNLELLTANPELPSLFGLVVVFPLLAFAIYLYVYGHRAARAKRIPAPGYAVIRDTAVHTGTRALVLGRIVQAVSLMIILASAMIPVFFWYVFSQLANDA